MTRLTYSTINHDELERAATAAHSLMERAKKYGVDDLSMALNGGCRLANILERLEAHGTLSEIALTYLQDAGFAALHNYASGNTNFADFSASARLEYQARQLSMEAQRLTEEAKRITEEANKRITEEAKRKLAEEAMWAECQAAQERRLEAKRVYDRDPRNIIRARQASLREKYGLSVFVAPKYFPRLMQILHRVDAGDRLSEDELGWLSTDAKAYYTEELCEGYHRNEARFYDEQFQETGDPWFAVNASSHYRKCRASAVADKMLAVIDFDRVQDRKLKSALCTTLGGVKRDLRQWREALDRGEEAHHLASRDFRPCTLLGAVNIEIGEYELGRYWYNEAEARGASLKSIDADLRSIFLRADQAGREALRAHLLGFDPIRYRWVATL